MQRIRNMFVYLTKEMAFFSWLSNPQLTEFFFFLLLTEEWYPQGKQNILPGQMTETLVTNLRPWTVYHLRVFAENQLGKSKDGKVLQVKTFLPFRDPFLCIIYRKRLLFVNSLLLTVKNLADLRKMSESRD